MKYYRSNTYSTKLEEVEVAKETEKCLILANGRRVNRDSSWEWYRKTRAEALAAVHAHLLKERAHAQSELDHVNKKLDQVAKFLGLEVTQETTTHALRPGGVMRCCVETLEDRIPSGPPHEGEVLKCKYCSESLIYRNGAWEWFRGGSGSDSDKKV